MGARALINIKRNALPKLKTVLNRVYARLEIDQRGLLMLIGEDPETFVDILTHYFDVPKGSDIHLLYNSSTSCRLNIVIWAPKVLLAVPKSAL
jgi:hypothetical protein